MRKQNTPIITCDESDNLIIDGKIVATFSRDELPEPEYDEITNMESKNKMEKDEEYWFNVGKSAGFEESALRLKEAALNAFDIGNDNEAKLLRGHSKHLLAKSKEVHPRLE